MCSDFFFALPSILMDTVRQERVKCTHTKCVGIPFSLLSLSRQASCIKREWTREWTKHIHNVCEFLLLSFLYLDGHRPSRVTEACARAHTHTHTMCGFPSYLFQLSWQTSSIKGEWRRHIHNVGVSFFSVPSILTDIVHQERMKNTHTQPMGIPSPFPLSWTKIIHNLCGLFLLSSLYFDGEDPSNINQMQTKRIVSWALWFHLSWQTLFVKSKWSMHEYTINWEYLL